MSLEPSNETVPSFALPHGLADTVRSPSAGTPKNNCLPRRGSDLIHEASPVDVHFSDFRLAVITILNSSKGLLFGFAARGLA